MALALKQQSKVNWIKFSDENSSYFHVIMRKERLENRITTFMKGDVIIDDFEEVVKHLVKHFENFMDNKSSAISIIDEACVKQGNYLSLEQQGRLIRPFNKGNVKKALFSIHPSKSPGLDGFGSGSYKDLWSKIGDEVSSAVLNFFENGRLSNILNETVIYLFLRLSDVLPSIVSDNQGAFIKNRLLAHKIMIFQDLLKGYTRKNVSARIQGSFKGKKGLRQGDPMSPLLFVLVMEYLTRLLSYYSRQKGFGFHPLCKHLRLPNLCFADDLVIFCKGNINSVRITFEAFTKFYNDTSLSANTSKSQIYFGGVREEIKSKILDIVQIEEGRFLVKYLVVQLRPTKWKASDCGIILDKLNPNCWASRNLSFASRAQLIHSVLLGIMNYWMSIFIIPSKITTAIDKSCRDFLWGSSGNKSKLHRTSWEKICLPKNLGGVGFREGKSGTRLCWLSICGSFLRRRIAYGSNGSTQFI
uniref:Reverse transcriptase domain-containing protein n=1 Tax=Cannabis sativa TaxID=3483 RepID=A0A803NHR2_CANSA